MKKVSKFFAEFDMFSALPTLRAKQQPQSSSLFSGVLSFVLTVFFSYVFFFNVVQILTHKDIKSLQTESRLSGNSVKADSIFFALRVGYLPANVSKKYFEIGYNVITEDGQNITFELQVCKKQQWVKLGDNSSNKLQQYFEQYKLGEFYCPNPSENLSLHRVYYASNPRYIVAYIRPCTNYQICQSEETQIQFIKNLTQKQGSIFLLVYFLDQQLNPQQEKSVSYTVNTDVQLGFTYKRRIIATVQFASFRVQTDIGVTPVEEIVVQQGNFLHSFRETSLELKNFTDNYAVIYMAMNRKYVHITRVVGKLDQMLSYAGGLFSILVGFLSIFINSYNEYRYELMVAEGVFHENEEGKGIKQSRFNILDYLKYSLFDWIKTLLCIKLNWEECQIIADTRTEAKCHLEVSNFFRRIQVMLNCFLFMMSKAQKNCLALVKPQNLNLIKSNRLVLEYYETILDNAQSMTFSQYLVYQRIFSLGLSLANIAQANTDKKLDQQPDKISGIAKQCNVQLVKSEQTCDGNRVLKMIFDQFVSIEEQANGKQLSCELLQIEKELGNKFRNLPQKTRWKIQQKIPIIILKRFKKHINLEQLRPEQEKKTKKQMQQVDIFPVLEQRESLSQLLSSSNKRKHSNRVD